MTYSSEVLADSPLAYYRLGDAAGPVIIVATASSVLGAEVAARAIDGNTTSYWTTTTLPAWIRFELAAAAVATGYTIRRRDDAPTTNPATWTVEGSNDGSSWTTLDTQTGITWGVAGENKAFSFTNTTPYLYYRLSVSATAGHAALSVAEFALTPAQTTVMSDSSGNARPGTYASQPLLDVASLIPTDLTNKAATLNGSSQYGWIGWASWQNVSSFTAEAWIKTTATGIRSIWDRDDTSAGVRAWQLRMSSGKLDFIRIVNAAGTTAAVGATSSATINDGVAHHVVATYDGSNIRLYVDGVLDNTVAASGGINQPFGVTVMSVGVNRNSGLNAFFLGTIDEAAYYGTALSGARIAAHYAAATSSGTTVSGGQSTESDSALTGAVKVGIVKAGGQATETDTALTGSVKVGIVVAGGQASEADTALAGSVSTGNTVAGGQASEVDEAFAGAVTVHTAVTGGQATETDEALTGAVHNGGSFVVGGQAVETDIARGGIVLQPNPTNQGDGNGDNCDGFAVVTWEPAVVAPPTGPLARDYIAAHAYTGVELTGRPHLVGHVTGERLRRRTRILVAGRDVSFLGGIATPEPTYGLISPLLYGSGSISFPQFPAFLWGTAAIPAWLKPGAPATIQRVNEEGAVTGTSYRGFLLDVNINGRDLSFGLAGQASGRLALIDVPPRTTRKRNSLEFWWDGLLRDARLPIGNSASTGIVLQNRGGTDGMSYANELSANGAKRGGAIYTNMPNTAGEYRVVQKNLTDIDATVYFDDAHTKPDLRRDPAEEPNVIWATAVAPSGRRIRFADGGVLAEQNPLPYPMNDGSPFGVGTTDGDTDTGGGVTAMIARLVWTGYLDPEDRPGGYDSDVVNAIEDLQKRAGLTQSGTMNENTWEALYDTTLSGYSVTGYQIRPAIQRAKVRRYNRTGSGAVLGPNPDFDPTVLPVHRTVDYGTGHTKNQVLDFAREDLHDADASNWVGSIVFNTGALILGEHTPGDPVGTLMDARQLKPGMNIWAPLFDGGTLLHVTGCDVGPNADGFPVVTAQVDTQARDTMAVNEIIDRNRESRRDPARNWARNYRSSGNVNDVVSEWDSAGGELPDDVPLRGGEWTVIGLPAGQEGVVQRIRVRLDNPTEFGMALFGKKIEATKLNNRLGNPLNPSDKANWQDAGILDDLDENHFLLGQWGDDLQPCGYWPRAKDDGGTLNGIFKDDASIPFFAFDDCSLFLAIYPAQDTTLKGGRILKNQLEAGS